MEAATGTTTDPGVAADEQPERKQTRYVVLAERGESLHVVGDTLDNPVEGSSDKRAIENAIGPEDEGVFVAVPARSFRIRRVKPEQITKRAWE
jgi:hypothetical protein